jgi:2-polyprenyl-3-methyl-5-hydroxy-6-metoxy-1,4-benzoquinol methylase
MLAVLEHVPRNEQADLAKACARVLRPGGRLIITTPSPTVDYLLRVLKVMRLIDGMALEQHYGFWPSEVAPLFETAGLKLALRTTFQLGLNNLFVFSNPGSQDDETTAPASP